MKSMTAEIPALCDNILRGMDKEAARMREPLLRIVVHLESIYQGFEVECWPDAVLDWHLSQIKSIADDELFAYPLDHPIKPFIELARQKICAQLAVVDETCPECGTTVKGGGLCYACRFQPSWGEYEPDTGP